MTPEQQRIAIAEACGWKRDDSLFTRSQGWRGPQGQWYSPLPPDYRNDLNAMHEAEKMFRAAIYCRYISELCDLAIKDNNCMYMATAAQRAEAFLRATGKWVES